MKTQLKHALTKGFFKTIGQSSMGIRLCYKHGLTSGKMLDYIYENKPTGSWLIGKSLDKIFLNHPGWVAIRTRRANLENLITLAINELAEAKRPINILDIASGPAAYLSSVIKHSQYRDQIRAVCQDLDPRWLEEGQRAAAAAGLDNMVYQQGDASNLSNVVLQHFRPSLIVASGLYDWVTDDKWVQDSLAMNYQTLEDDGYLVMTNQISHPDLEMAQSVFVDFDNNPLRMTMRPQTQVNEWLADAGFKIEQCLICENNYFSVTLAQKTRH